MRSLGAGCSTRRGRCSEPPPSHLRRGTARHVDPITYVQVGVPPRGVTLDPQCSAALVSMSNDWQHWAQRSRHTPRCTRSPRCSAALVSMGNDWQHWAEWTRRGLAYESNIPKSLLCPKPQATTSHQESCRLPRSAQVFFARQHQPLYHLHTLQLHRKAKLDKCSARNQGRTEKRGTQSSVTLEHLALQSDQRKRCGT